MAPSHPLPQHLQHKPVWALGYENLDGIYAGNTDLQWITIGLAQYNNEDVAIKTMRHTGNKWSRQAEELPVHRVIDMTLFLAKTLLDVSPTGSVTFPAGTFVNQTTAITISREHRSSAELGAYDGFVQKHGHLLKKRLNKLADTLNELRAAGRL
jgi:hypothetical protein